jgi:hypothetical protein
MIFEIFLYGMLGMIKERREEYKYGLKLWDFYLIILPYNLDSSGKEAT